MWDLKTCTRRRAMTPRRIRRISSSLLPLNMTPLITSMEPGRVPEYIAGWVEVTGTGYWVLGTGYVPWGSDTQYPVLVTRYLARSRECHRCREVTHLAGL